MKGHPPWTGRKEINETALQRIADNQQLSKRRGLKVSKSMVKASKQELKQTKIAYKSDRVAQLKEDVRIAKREVKINKRVRKAAYDRVGGTKKQKLARSGKQAVRRMGEAAWQDNDVLEDIVEARQKIRGTHATVRSSKMIAHLSKNVSKGVIKGSYGVVNRSYNLVRGRGFTRTLKNERWEIKIAKKYRAFKQRLKASKVGKTIRGTSKAIQFLAKPFTTILTNPLSLKAGIVAFFLLFFFSLFFGNVNPVSQDEFDLNESWLQLSKRDREKSTDKVEYWTNIDDILFYMNFRYGGEWNPESSWKDGTGGELAGQLGFNHYSDALNDIWNHLNDNPDQLKTMVDLYGASSSLKWAKLSKEDLDDYKELVELSKEIGSYPSYQELYNPFYLSTEDKYNEPLQISKRFGYSSKDKTYDYTTFQVEKGRPIYAPMSGTIEVTKNKDVLIKTEEAVFTFKNITEIQYETGDQIKTEERIGTVVSDVGQEVSYRKLEERATKKDKAKWTYVNPGFYFQHVKYIQETKVLSLNVDADKAQRVRFIYDYLKKRVSGATISGAAGFLGNWDVESGINAKRAEGDYLAPPVGATATSWDDPTWLSMSGPSIYGGGFPNILRRGLGLGQWTDTGDGSTRHTLLLNYAKAKNKPWYDLELQLDFLLNGDAPAYQKIARDILTSDGSVEDLTYRFLVQWEGNPGDKLPERTASAKQWAAFLKNGGGQKGRGGHMFNEPYEVIQPYGRTPWSQGAGAWMYPKGRHDGVDFVPVRASYNSPVVYANDIPVFSVTGGTVLSVNGPTQWGNSIVIQTDMGGIAYYGHLKYVPPFSPGAKINKGDQIAVLGDTGTVGIPHVHFMYYYGSSSNDVDPSFLFKENGPLLQNEVIIP